MADAVGPRTPSRRRRPARPLATGPREAPTAAPDHRVGRRLERPESLRTGGGTASQALGASAAARMEELPRWRVPLIRAALRKEPSKVEGGGGGSGGTNGGNHGVSMAVSQWAGGGVQVPLRTLVGIDLKEKPRQNASSLFSELLSKYQILEESPAIFPKEQNPVLLRGRWFIETKIRTQMETVSKAT
ncbi:hypothetical protein STEG23_028073, partial [Scotinomys teguina]